MIPITKRRSVRYWTMSLKSEVLNATPEIQRELMERFNISNEELECWSKMHKAHGTLGLRVTKIQEYERI